MNKTKIDWCDSTWNPVTGCNHGCEYCYARGIAQRFGKILPDRSEYPKANNGMHCVESKIKENPYPYLFEPTYHPYRLNEPAQKKSPQTIFVCSMADLFGEWVPDDVILDVFRACEAAPQHRYLFLTKNPERYMQLRWNKKLPSASNMWFGTTVTGTEQQCFVSPSHNTFVSVEPMHENVGLAVGFDLVCKVCKWVILGAETGNRPDKILPKPEWIDEVKAMCARSNTSLFMKDNLAEVYNGEFVKQYPWKE